MAAPIEIRLTANTTDVIKEAKKAGESFEDVSDSLDDLAKNADGLRIGDHFGADVKDGTRDAERAVEKLDRKFNDLADNAQKQARNAGDDVEREIKKGTDGASEGFQSFKEEAIQNISEVASSTTGDMADLADGVQGTLGGLASSIPGPVGIAAAGIAAIGGAVLAGTQQQAERTKEVVEDALEDMIETGNQAVSDSFLQAEVLDVLNDPALYSTAQKAADALGLPVETLVASFAGYPDAIKEVEDATADFNVEKDKAVASYGDALPAFWTEQTIAVGDATDAIVAQGGALDTAAGKAKLYADTQKKYSDDGAAASKRAQDQETARFIEFANNDRKLRGLPPITIPTDLQVPDAGALVRRIQTNINGQQRVKVGIDIVDRYGKNY